MLFHLCIISKKTSLRSIKVNVCQSITDKDFKKGLRRQSETQHNIVVFKVSATAIEAAFDRNSYQELLHESCNTDHNSKHWKICISANSPIDINIFPLLQFLVAMVTET
jgi:RNase P protein component